MLRRLSRKFINSTSDDASDLPDIKDDNSELVHNQMELKTDIQHLLARDSKIESNQERIGELEEKVKSMENMIEELSNTIKEQHSMAEAQQAFLGLKTKIQQRLITNLMLENELKRNDLLHLPILREQQWEFINFYNCPSSHFDCWFVGYFLVFYGGKNKSNEIRIYNIKESNWEYTKITSYPRYNYTSEKINNEIFIFGGQDENGKSCSNIIKIDLSDLRSDVKELKNLKNQPNEFHSHTSILNNDGKVVIFGGVETVYFLYSKKRNFASNKLYQFDPQNETWELIETIGTAPKPCKNHTAVFSKEFNSMVVFAGEYYDEISDKYKNTNDTYIFDFRTFTWTKQIVLGKNPSPRHGHTSFISNDLMFIFGGFEMGKVLKNDLFQFDLESKYWTEVTLLMPPSPRMFCGSVFFENTFYMFGGIGANNEYLSDGFTLTVKIAEQEVVIPNVKESKKLKNLRRESKKLVEDLKNMEEVYNDILLKK